MPEPRLNNGSRPAGGTHLTGDAHQTGGAHPAGGAESPADAHALAGSLPPGLDRRGFLRTTAGGTVAIALASMIPAGCAADYPQAALDGAELEGLSEKEYAVMKAAAEALLVGVPVSPERVARRLDVELARVGDPVLGDMKTVLTVLEHLTLLGGRMRRFTALAPADRLAYLDSWKHSRFTLRRAVFQAVRSAVFFFAYSDDATRALTGFEGPWPERVAIPAYPVDFGEVV